MKTTYRLLLTREELDNIKTAEIFKKYNIDTISLPMIKTIKKPFELHSFDFENIIFSSKKGVDIFFDNVCICKNANIRFYAVGTKTAEKISSHNPVVKDSIKDIIPLLEGKTIWIRTEFELPEDIKLMIENKDIFILKAYETKILEYNIDLVLDKLSSVDGVFFASPSAFLGLLKNLQNYKSILNEKDIYAIGNTTKQAIEKEGFKVAYTPEKPSIEEIASYIKDFKAIRF